MGAFRRFKTGTLGALGRGTQSNISIRILTNVRVLYWESPIFRPCTSPYDYSSRKAETVLELIKASTGPNRP